MNPIEFHILTSDQYEEALSDELMALGAAAITCQDAGNQPIYEPLPGSYHQWKKTLLIALFEETVSLTPIQDYLSAQLAVGTLEQFTHKTVEDINWVAHTQRQFNPQAFGKRLWICPSWETPPEPNAVNVILDPGCAFGTGTHPTTALCLAWLDENIQGNETVIDYGCGSGILAVAALKLGAKHAVAIDYDPLALEVTQLNARQNLITDSQLTTALPDELAPAPADILMANIIAGPLIELAPRFASLLESGKKLVLSGILDTQLEDIISTYSVNFYDIKHMQQDEWLRVEAVRK